MNITFDSYSFVILFSFFFNTVLKVQFYSTKHNQQSRDIFGMSKQDNFSSEKISRRKIAQYFKNTRTKKENKCVYFIFITVQEPNFSI
jgi:hypothetical protein